MAKIDCEGEGCALCHEHASCLRLAFLTRDGEYADYTDLCFACAEQVARHAGILGADFQAYHDRMVRRNES